MKYGSLYDLPEGDPDEIRDREEDIKGQPEKEEVEVLSVD